MREISLKLRYGNFEGACPPRAFEVLSLQLQLPDLQCPTINLIWPYIVALQGIDPQNDTY
jgi:hypothetical protein